MSADDPAALPKRWSKDESSRETWIDPGADPRYSGGKLVDERSTLLDYLRAYRLTLQMKCEDLDPGQMALRSVPPSPMSLLGLVRHMARVERNWFRRVMASELGSGEGLSPEDWSSDWEGATSDTALVKQAWASWRDEVAFADSFLAKANDLDALGRMADGETLQLREVLVHMIEEYARHCGHADLLRERIDGRIGQ